MVYVMLCSIRVKTFGVNFLTFMYAANFTDADLPSPPVLDAVLEPGDLLYFPRGYIHQVSTEMVIHLHCLIIFTMGMSEVVMLDMKGHMVMVPGYWSLQMG